MSKSDMGSDSWVTIVIWAGIVLMVAGASLAVADLSEQFEIVSIVVTCLGLALSAGVALWDNGRDDK